jgi:hypothetical protein
MEILSENVLKINQNSFTPIVTASN